MANNPIILAGSSAIQARVEFSAIALSKLVLTVEAANVPNHAERVKLAQTVFLGTSNLVQQLTKIVLSNPAIGAASPSEDAFLSVVGDSDIISELNSSWTLLAVARFPAPTVP